MAVETQRTERVEKAVPGEELEAIIEEARRRARRRRMGYAAALLGAGLLVGALILSIGGGGGKDAVTQPGASTPAPGNPEQASRTRHCRYPNRGSPGRGNRVHVSGGATCRDALVLFTLGGPGFGQIPARYNAEQTKTARRYEDRVRRRIGTGWDCLARPARRGGTPLRVVCADGAKRVRYLFY